MSIYFLPNLDFDLTEDGFTKLLKCAYEGPFEAVKQLVEIENKNIYFKGCYSRTALFCAAAANKQDTVNYLLNIYEKDFQHLYDYLESQQINKDEFIENNTVLIAFGDAHVQQVLQLANELGTNTSSSTGIIVMCKNSNLGIPTFMRLQQKNRNNFVKLLKLVSNIYEDGILGVHVVCEEANQVVINAAAYHGNRDLIIRLVKLGAPLFDEKEGWNGNYNIIRTLFEKDHTNIIKELYEKYNISYLKKLHGYTIEALIIHKMDFELFKFFMDRVIAARMTEYRESRNEAIRNIVKTESDDGYQLLSLFEIRPMANNWKAIEQIIEHYEIELTEIKDMKSSIIATWIFSDCDNDGIELVMKILRKNPLIISSHDDCMNVVRSFGWQHKLKELKELCTMNPNIISWIFENTDQLDWFSNALLCGENFNMIASMYDYFQIQMEIQKILEVLLEQALKCDAMNDNVITLLSFSAEGFLSNEIENSVFLKALVAINPENIKPYLTNEKLVNYIKNNKSSYKLLFNGFNEQQKFLIRYQYSELPKDEYNDIQNRWYNIFNELVLMGANPHCINVNDGYTLLHMAVQCNHFELVQKLLDLKVDSMQFNNDGYHIIHLVQRRDVLELLVDRLGQRILKIRTKSGNTVLSTCIQKYCWNENRCNDILTAMLELGCDPNDADEETGNSPIFYARSVSQIDLLIRYSANVNKTNKIFKTPICEFLQNFPVDLGLKLLNCDQLDWKALHNGTTMFNYLYQIDDYYINDFFPIFNDHLDNLKYLARISFAKQISNQEFPFNIFRGNKYCRNIVLELCKTDDILKNYDIKKSKDQYYWDEFESDDHELFEQVLLRGYEINFKNQNDETPLMAACERGRYKHVELILKASPEIKSQNDFYNTAFGRTCLGFNWYNREVKNITNLLKVLTILTEYGAGYNSLHQSAKSPYNDIENKEIQNLLKAICYLN